MIGVARKLKKSKEGLLVTSGTHGKIVGGDEACKMYAATFRTDQSTSLSIKAHTYSKMY